MIRLLIILCFCGGAHAASWSYGGAVGTSQLDARHHDDAEVATEPVAALHVNWWFHRQLALEAGWVHARTGYRTDSERVNRDFDAALVGLRGVMPLGDRFFVQARVGFASLHIDTDTGGVQATRDGADRSHYLGAGLGWRWNTRWQSTLDLTRIYGDVAYGCEFGACTTTHSSHFDSLSFGLAVYLD